MRKPKDGSPPDPSVDGARSPQSRLGEREPGVYESALRAMFEALPELPVGVDETGRDGAVEIVGRLGEGGMGVVELAVQLALGREVALKRLPEAPRDPREGFSLLDEARILGGLEHPNIVPVHAVGVDPELGPVVLLKRIQGVSWGEDLRDDSDLLPGDARALEKHLRVLEQVCHAVHFAHSRGVFHRDIKPDNVMLGAYGEVYLLDWGLALDETSAANAPLAIAGTASYMAPEMVEGDPSQVDARTDVYLLGATLHQILTGEPRHPSSQVLACLAQAALSKPARYGPEVPPQLAAICNAACAKDKAARFEGADQLRDAIRGYLDEREAQMLVQAARDALEDADSNPDRAGRRIGEARFATEQALKARPGLADAARMKKRCIHAAIRLELDRGNLVGARDAIEDLGGAPLPASLAERLAHVEAEVEHEAARIAQMDRDRDPEVSRRDRLRFGLFGLVLISAYHAGLFWAWPASDGDLSAAALLTGGAILVVPLVAFIALAGRRLWDTAIGRQFGWILVGINAALIAGRLLGWIGGMPTAHVLTFELGLMAMIPLTVDIPIRGRLVMAMAGFATAATCVAWPSWARYAHAAFTLFGALVIVLDNAMPRAPEARASLPPTLKD